MRRGNDFSVGGEPTNHDKSADDNGTMAGDTNQANANDQNLGQDQGVTNTDNDVNSDDVTEITPGTPNRRHWRPR